MEMLPGGGARSVRELPVVDEVLAAALRAQGEGGVRALGLLRDAHQILSSDSGLERPGEIVEACVRSAADALLKLPGAPKNPAGLQSAATGLLAAVDAFGSPHAGSTAPGRQAPAGSPDWEPVAEAAEVLRGEIQSPGGHRRRQARGIAERLTGLRLGAAQDKALDTWGALYSKASGTLHGAGAEEARPARLYTELLHAARELLVPLPGRAARVLELTALTDPGPDDAAELARWTDPRAEAFFFRSGPSPAWLGVLDEHAGHLLLTDEENGVWPAAPFLEHLNATAPDTARPWLAAHAGQLAAGGPAVLDALLRLALAGALTPAAVRSLLPHITAPPLPGAPAGQGGFARRLAARWARTLPVAARDGDWVVVAEMLLTDAVDAEHTGHLALRAVLERAHAAQDAAPGPGAERAAAVADLELEEAIARQSADRLPGRDVTGLLRELTATVHPAAGGEGGAFRWARAVRGAVAGLLRRDLEATSSAARQPVFDVDLDEVHLGDPAASAGPALARTVLDLAAADAAAGLPLAERLRAWPRIAQTDAHLHARLLAAHLAAHPPHTTDPHTAPAPDSPAPVDAAGTGEWWDLAMEATERLLADRPTPEGARLADLVLTTCPPERAEDLHRRARATLGPAPAATEVEQVLPASAERVDGILEPLASWLRVWDWSPVLTTPLLEGFGPLLAAVRRLRPTGPPDPRAAEHPVPLKRTVTLTEEELLELAAAAGPLEAAAALAAAEDTGADGYAIVLHRLVEADPAAWTADVPAVLTALDRAELGAFYLAATANAAHRPGALAGGPAPAARAALGLRRTLPAPVPGQPDLTVVLFADQALFDLLTLVWRTGTDLAEDLAPALDHLHALAAPLTTPAVRPPGLGPDNTVLADDTALDESAAPAPADGLPGSDPAVRALGCLLEYAAAQVRTGAPAPGDVLDLVAAALTARGGEEALTTAIGVALPFLHRHAAEFTAAHPDLYALTPGQPTPAAAWLYWGGYDPLLLTALGARPLLDAVRANLPGADRHLAHTLLTHTGDVLGDPSAAWAELAAGPDGAPTASRLLAALAAHTPRRTGPGDTEPDPAARRVLAAAARWWTAALDADLPPGALAAAGDFADTALADTVWLPLARRSAAHTPAQTRADDIAERAAAHPRDNDALLLAAHLLTRSALAPWYDIEVRAHARTLLLAADAQPAPEHVAATEQLRRTLVDAGEMDLARTTPTTS
ncbi:hypothetical protein [Streptomyces poriferorum]|uniref:Secreted protein n=1 Tax=Streptomyces poriferorum TaxID=2798799 RepID=A0ABY9J106_9ACTN|nr:MULTISPECIES: hypothetical protein [unclassified Streptomyces]MDP5315569.1 hypothetical protein [Streptomyces sp. Alt4]WLQ61505.1 hypothetical protein P8A19_00020 [Streptomyces sp. Alt2]